MRGVFDLNCDAGESFGAWVMGNDAEVMRHVTSANIACGVHASDPKAMRRTVWFCKQCGVMAGAHPGYPDLQGFGRRRMDMERGEIIDWVIYQVGALKGFTSLAGIPLQHVKLHGALYNYVSREEDLFLDIAGAVREAFGDVVFVTFASPASGELKKRCRSSGVRIALEAFPDRAYTDEGALVARGHEGAVINDPKTIASRAIGMVREGCIESVNGRRIACEIDTLCIHGDNKESVLAAPLIREHAAMEGIAVKPLGSFV
jgi:UPF0271 protein